MEQPVLEVLIRIVSRKVSDYIENLHGNLLLHGLNAVVKLGFAQGHSLQTELGSGCTNHILMFSGQNVGSFTATASSRSGAVSVGGTGTPSRMLGSPGIANS